MTRPQQPPWIATLKAEINNYAALPDNWDGYGAKTPFPWSVSDSISFLDKAPANFPPANAMLSPEGFILYLRKTPSFRSGM